jgi:hypothetical protein
VAERVVDLFEVVEVDQQQGDHAVLGAAREVLLGPLVQLAAVGQAGQRVVRRVERVLLVEALQLGVRGGVADRGA